MAKDIVKFEKSVQKDLDDPTKTPDLTNAERAQQKEDVKNMILAWSSADLNTGTPGGTALILTQGILGAILGGNSVMAGVENGASVIASNVIADQVQKALKDAGLNIDPKGHPDATFANILAQAVATGVGAAMDGSEGGLASQSHVIEEASQPTAALASIGMASVGSGGDSVFIKGSRNLAEDVPSGMPARPCDRVRRHRQGCQR